MITFRHLQKEWPRLHALAFVTSLVRATVDRSNSDPRLSQATHDIIIDRESFLSADVSLRNPALIRHDEEGEIAKAAQR